MKSNIPNRLFNGQRTCFRNKKTIRLLTCFLAFVFLCTATQSPAQNKITTSQLLSDKPTEAGSMLFNSNIQFLKEAKQEMPVVNKMEFRTETDELDISRQEYLVRMSINSRKTRKVQNEINKNNARFYELKSQIAEEAKLVNRYKLVVDWYYTQSELNYLKEIIILKEDEKAVHQKMLANSTELDIEDLLKAEEEIRELDRKVLQLNLEKDHIIQQLLPDPELSAPFEFGFQQMDFNGNHGVCFKSS